MTKTRGFKKACIILREFWQLNERAFFKKHQRLGDTVIKLVSTTDYEEYPLITLTINLKYNYYTFHVDFFDDIKDKEPIFITDKVYE